MGHEILSVKLCEMEEQFSRLSSRIHLSETEDHLHLKQEIERLSKECAETELTLKEKLRLSRANIVSVLANSYENVEQIVQKTKSALEMQMLRDDNTEAESEGKILLAEYALDFAAQAANRALLLSMEAIDAQLLQQQERSSS